MLISHQTSISKFKKIEIISNIFSYHSAMRLEIHYKKKKNCKNANTWRLNNMLLNNQWITEEIKEEINRYLETNENENNNPKSMDVSKSSSKREVYSNTSLPQEIRNIPNNLISHLKELDKEEQTKPAISTWKEIKIRAETSEMETFKK